MPVPARVRRRGTTPIVQFPVGEQTPGRIVALPRPAAENGCDLASAQSNRVDPYVVQRPGQPRGIARRPPQRDVRRAAVNEPSRRPRYGTAIGDTVDVDLQRAPVQGACNVVPLPRHQWEAA